MLRYTNPLNHVYKFENYGYTMKKLKIAIFTDVFLPKIDGVVSATLNLAKGMADRGHKIYIIAPKNGHNNEFKYKNIKVIRISSIPALFYPEFKLTTPFSLKLYLELKKEKIDVIHFQTPLTIGLMGIIIGKMLKIPIVGTFHTMIADPQYLQHIKINGKIVQETAWRYARAFYNRCDLITCPSENIKRELLENKLKLPIKVISNGIDCSIFDNSQWKKFKDKYNISEKTLLFIGRIAYEKNIFYLLDCFKLVLNKMPEVKLILVGDGPQINDVRRKIHKEGMDSNVILAGKINHSSLVKSGIFKACDIFVSASITENQPMTILEAQANGLPCVGISEKGMKNLIIDGHNGYLAKLDDKNTFAGRIVNLLKNKKLLNKMKKNTLKEIKIHRLPEVIKTWEKEYNGLIKSLISKDI